MSIIILATILTTQENK
ncbi:hypothetical protein [Escherichia coli]